MPPPKKKRWIAGLFLAIWILWDNFGKPIWNLNVERWAEQETLDTQLRDNAPDGWWDSAMSWGVDAINYVSGPFGLGFALGALLFAFWDPIARYGKLVFGKDPKNQIETETKHLRERRLMMKEQRATAQFASSRKPDTSEQPDEKLDDGEQIKHPPTSAYDLPKKLAVIDGLLEIVGSEKEYERLYRRGKEIARNWANFLSEKGTDDFARDVEEFGEACNTMFHKINEIRKANERYQDIWNILNPTSPGSMSGAASKFMVAVRNLGTPPTNEFKFFMQPFAEQFETRLDAFGKWRFRCEKALLARRMELSG